MYVVCMLYLWTLKNTERALNIKKPFLVITFGDTDALQAPFKTPPNGGDEVISDDVDVDLLLCDLEDLVSLGHASHNLLHVGPTWQALLSGPSGCERCFLNGSVHTMEEGRYGVPADPL
jgi:hypothetical protein